MFKFLFLQKGKIGSNNFNQQQAEWTLEHLRHEKVSKLEYVNFQKMKTNEAGRIEILSKINLRCKLLLDFEDSNCRNR